MDWPYTVPALSGNAGLAAHIEFVYIDLTVAPSGSEWRYGDILLHDIAGIACIVSDIPRAISIKIDDSNNSIVWNLNQPIRRNRSCTAQIQDATSDSAAHFDGGGPFRQCNILLLTKPVCAP